MTNALVPGTASEREILVERLADAVGRWQRVHGDVYDGSSKTTRKWMKLHQAEQALANAYDALKKGVA